MILRESPTGQIVEGTEAGGLLVWDASLQEWVPGSASGAPILTGPGLLSWPIIPPGGAPITYSVPFVHALPTRGALILPLGGTLPFPITIFGLPGCAVAGTITGLLGDASGAGTPAGSAPVVCIAVIP